jgi:polysaccharide export outer membrane protein
MPYLKRVPVAGLSLQEAQDKITALLKADYLVHPQVRIEVDQFKARSILMTGEVKIQGKLPLPGTTMSLLEALALAGSATQSASNEVLIMHAPKPGEKAPEPIVVNRKDLELGRVGRDITLQDGDIVNIPVAKRFYISGFVKNPGSFVLDSGTTVAQAMILAGGLSERGSDRRISIVRTGPDGKTLEITVKKDDKVLPNDEIKVKSRFF